MAERGRPRRAGGSPGPWERRGAAQDPVFLGAPGGAERASGGGAIPAGGAVPLRPRALGWSWRCARRRELLERPRAEHPAPTAGGGPRTCLLPGNTGLGEKRGPGSGRPRPRACPRAPLCWALSWNPVPGGTSPKGTTRVGCTSGGEDENHLVLKVTFRVTELGGFLFVCFFIMVTRDTSFNPVKIQNINFGTQKKCRAVRM